MPSWITRRGISLIGVILAGTIVCAYFFKFPDLITARITISSSNPPVKLVARGSLPIQHIFVGNNDDVKGGQTLCVFSNAATYPDIQKIIPIVRQLDTAIGVYTALQKVKIPAGLELGEMQPAYTDLCVAIQDYLFFADHNAYQATIGSLTKQVAYTGQLQQELGNKERMLQEQLALEHNRFAVDSSLVTEKVISPMEYNDSKRKMLDQQMDTRSNKSSIIQNSLQQIGYRKDIAQLTLQKQSDENSLQQKVKDALRRFDGAYAQWEQSYVLKSPTPGKVTFFKYWKENQSVTAGEGVMVITPPVQEFVARGIIGSEHAGRIKAGQRVVIKLAAYPFEEYGSLKGRIVARSNVAMDSNYSLEIQLDDGLTTSAGKTIPQQPELEAVGEILTDDKSVLERLFEKVLGKLD